MSTLAVPYSTIASTTVDEDLSPTWIQLLCLWSLQAVVAVVMKQVTFVATAHAVLAMSVVLYFGLIGRRSSAIAYGSAYIVGSEVLWRMCRAQVPWEFGKYCLILVLAVTLFRMRSQILPLVPMLYFMALLPGVVGSMFVLSVDEVRNTLSFNLSGPTALLVCSLFFQNVKLSLPEIRWLFLFAITPTVGVAAVAAYGTYGRAIEFGSTSNKATSGGFGPNQVSSILGMGALLCVMYLLSGAKGRNRTIVVSVVSVFLLMQCVMTFSRGGLYGAVGAFAPALLFILQDERLRRKAMSLIMFLIIAAMLVFPMLNTFTGGSLGQRFEKTSTTGRDRLMEQDMQAFLDHPIFGTGVGVSPKYHWENLVSHTEQSRLVAEHGIFGIFALLCLVAFGVNSVLRARTPVARAFASSMWVWGFLYMMTAGMRLAAPAYFIGLCCLQWKERQSRE